MAIGATEMTLEDAVKKGLVKEGDKIFVKKNPCCRGVSGDCIFDRVEGGGDFHITRGDGTNVCCTGDTGGCVIQLNHQNKKGIMASLKELYRSITKSEPDKSLNKAGITDSNDELTEDGKDLYLQWRLQQDKAQFKTDVADPINAANAEKE